MVGLGKLPWASTSVSRIVDPLRAEPLRTTLVEGDAVFQVGSVPGRAVACVSGILQEM
jgi:hypothetical protein